jgi:AraC-like DNA-binding protein
MDSRIRILLRIIDEHGGTLRLTSQEIGGLLGLGEARVLRLFSREVGKTLRQYLLEVRMARAARLLSDLGLPIKTVAFHCGYSIPGNFCRDFKRVHGISPLQMRHRHINTQLLIPRHQQLTA